MPIFADLKHVLSGHHLNLCNPLYALVCCLLNCRQSNTKCKAVVREISNSRVFTFRESSKKLVLCCSALTTAERVTFYEQISFISHFFLHSEFFRVLMVGNGNCRKLLLNFRDYLEFQCYKNGMIALHILLHQQMKMKHVKEPSKF